MTSDHHQVCCFSLDRFGYLVAFEENQDFDWPFEENLRTKKKNRNESGECAECVIIKRHLIDGFHDNQPVFKSNPLPVQNRRVTQRGCFGEAFHFRICSPTMTRAFSFVTIFFLFNHFFFFLTFYTTPNEYK